MDINNYTFTGYQPEYRTQMLDLLAYLWGQDTGLNSAYFDWKYLHNPYADRPRINLALNQDTVVGVRGYAATCWYSSNLDRTVVCLSDADAVVHPEHRRQGLLKSLTFEALEEMQSSPYRYIITLSANRSSAAANIKMGWKNAGYFETAHLVPDKLNERPSLIRRIGRKVPFMRSIYQRIRPDPVIINPEAGISQSTFRTFDRNAESQKSQFNTNIFITEEPKPVPMAGLVSKNRGSPRLMHVRDQQYFEWRFQNPRSEYRFLYWGNEPLAGYMILRSGANINDGEVLIADWEATSLSIFRELLQTAIQLGDFKLISLWSETLSTDMHQLLTDYGFQFSIYDENDPGKNFPPLLLVRPIIEVDQDTNWQIDDRSLLDIANWDIRAIFSDGV